MSTRIEGSRCKIKEFSALRRVVALELVWSKPLKFMQCNVRIGTVNGSTVQKRNHTGRRRALLWTSLWKEIHRTCSYPPRTPTPTDQHESHQLATNLHTHNQRGTKKMSTRCSGGHRFALHMSRNGIENRKSWTVPSHGSLNCG